MRTTTFTLFDYLPDPLREIPRKRAAEALGLLLLAFVAAASLALLTWSVADPSLNHATSLKPHTGPASSGRRANSGSAAARPPARAIL